MANTYNPYSDIQKVYNAKVGWNNATTDEERKRQNEIATSARKNLEAYGYSDVAQQISASGADATATRKIMESYAPVAPTSTNNSNTELITKNNNEIRNKTNQLWGIQENDRTEMAKKYDTLESTAYSNPFTTDEAKAILAKYDLAGLQGRDNEVASVGATNGGNIDSFAAANALRQQSALINQGQMAVLDAHNNKINNVKGILESLGVYQQNQDIGMQNTIGVQQEESQRLFDNEETAKNNEAARQEVYSNISGTVGDKVTQYLNSNIWNDDGTLKNYDTDYQASINSLETTLKSTTDENERAKIKEQLRLLEAARNQKIDEQGLSYGKTYKYQSAPQTAAMQQFNTQNDTTLKSLNIESDLTKYEIDTNKAISDAANKNAIDQINAQTQGQKEVIAETAKYGNVKVDKNGNVVPVEDNDLMNGNLIDGDGEPESDEWNKFVNTFSDKKSIQNFLTDYVKDIYNKADEFNPDGTKKYKFDTLEDMLITTIKKHTGTYDIDVADARKILAQFGADSSWLTEYEDYWRIDPREGMHKK